MKKPRTNAEVEAEIATLEELKPKVRRLSAFGDDNHAAIGAQVKVLRNRMDEDDAYERYDDEDYLADAATEAARWLAGDEDEAPSVGWKALAS